MKKVISIKVVVLFISTILTSCYSNSEKNDKSNAHIESFSDKVELDETENYNVKSDLNSIHNLLQGKWQSIDDKTNFLVFDKNQRKEIAEGTTSWESEEYILSNKCLNESDIDNGLELEKDKYISCVKLDLCWYILSVDNDFLTLSFMSRGNTLKYKKV